MYTHRNYMAMANPTCLLVKRCSNAVLTVIYMVMLYRETC